MHIIKPSIGEKVGRRIVASLTLLVFLLTSGVAPFRYAYAQELFQLPQPGVRLSLSPAFTPPLLKGVKVYADNPFRLDFILDKGDSSAASDQLKAESTRLIKYFLASITVPEKDLWVNLSPYEQERIIPDAFGVTEMGRDLLAQDYMLKQITASVIYPEEAVGKEFWNKVYAEAMKQYGTTDIPLDTFNKVWIVPEKAVVYENADSAYIVESRLKVMLEEDYLALEKNTPDPTEKAGTSETHQLGSQIVREVVIPILEKEVNEGKNFAQLRQVYHSLILAAWFKDKVRESLFGQAYVDKDKVVGVDIEDKAAKDKIWAQYVEAFKKGVYNYIKEEYDPVMQETLPRKYFSGGVGFGRELRLEKTHERAQLSDRVSDRTMVIRSDMAVVDRPEDMKRGLAQLQAYGEGSGGLLDLEQNYNQSRVMMRLLSGFAGAVIGGLGGYIFSHEPSFILATSVLGAGLMERLYSLTFPKSEYRLIEWGTGALAQAKTAEDVRNVRRALIDGMAEANSPLSVRVGLTGLEECDHILAGQRDERYTLVFPPFARPLEPQSIRQIESNLAALGLGDMVNVVVHDYLPFFSVAPVMPSEAQREVLKSFIRDEGKIESIFAGTPLTDNEITMLKGMIWYGLFDLLYRQEGSDNFTPEHQALYANNEIFLDPNVLRPLSRDITRPQEDYLVETLSKKMDPAKKYRILVFATGSGVLVNNILQKLPNVEAVVEYDASKNSNEVADAKRKETLPPALYNKVRQITADVKDFDTQLQGEKFDFVISTASLRFMNEQARGSVARFLKEGVLLKDGGAFVYMDTRAHGEMIKGLSDDLEAAGMKAAITSNYFPGHRDTMFYVFVHEYQRNALFRRQVDRMMARENTTDLPSFLYQMAGLRPIGFDLLVADQAKNSTREEQFNALVSELSGQVTKSIQRIFPDARVSTLSGPSSKVTIDLLGKNSAVEKLDSYEISVDTSIGQVARITIYDGRSIGVNTLILGRMALQNPEPPPVIITQHLLTSKFGYEKAAEELGELLSKTFPGEKVDWSGELDAFAEAVVGLSKVQIQDIIRAELGRGVQSNADIRQALKMTPRLNYPSQEHESFRGAGEIFRDTAIRISQMAIAMGYDSLSGVVSLPDGLQNLALYQRFGFRPVIPEEMREQFNVVQELLAKRKAGTLKSLAWSLAQDMKQQMLILIQKPLPVSTDNAKDAAMKANKDLRVDQLGQGWQDWVNRLKRQAGSVTFLLEILRGKVLALSAETMVHYLKVRQIVNRDNTPKKVLYGGSGGDLLAPALAVGPGEVYMATREKFDYERFRKFMENNWNASRNRLPTIFTRMFGYNTWRAMNTEEKFFDVLLNNLRALEIGREDVEVGIENNLPFISIRKTWPGESASKVTKFYFLEEKDLTNPEVYSENLKALLQTGVDVFLQKAAHTMPEKYEQWLPVIARGVRDKGYLALDTNPFSPVKAKPRYEPVPVLKKDFKIQSVPFEDADKGYGSFDTIIQMTDLPMTSSTDDRAMRTIPERVLSSAASTLAEQNANIVLEEINGRWRLRRGPIDLELDAELSRQLGEALAKRGEKTLLLSLRQPSVANIRDALSGILNSTGDIVDILAAKGIKATYSPKKVLLVAPYGDMEGHQLKYKVPHKGVEILAHRLLRETDDTDALVYNPNLSSEEALYEFVRTHQFDVIAVSIVQSVMKKNLEILGKLKQLSPDSLFAAGGGELKKFPLKEVFESWPLDILFTDGGTSFVDFIRNYSPARSRGENLAAALNLPNAAFNTPAGVKAPRVTREPVNIPTDLDKDIPYDKPDLVHQGQYEKVNPDAPQPIAFDRIGRNPYRVYLGNYCRGRCIFCGTTLNTQRDMPPDQVIKLVKGRPGETDSLHFESADFLFDQQNALGLSGALAAEGDIRRIPKMAIARVDEIGDGSILEKMREAGFRIVAFGVESFDDRVLQGIGKNTTAEKNFATLREAIRVGIKPGINLILFTPWDTVDTTLNTINQSLYFMERGAYINVVPYLFVGYGRKISAMEDVIGYETYDFPGMKAPFRFPRLNRILDGQLAGMRQAVYDKLHTLEETNDYPLWSKRSVSVYSLLIFKAFVQVLQERSVERPGADYNQYLKRIDEAIARVLASEESTLKGAAEPKAVGVAETWFDPFNQTLQRAVLMTEDGRTLVLRQNDGALQLDEHGVPVSAVYDIFVLSNGQERYKGYVRLDSRSVTDGERGRYEIYLRTVEGGDAFIHRTVSDFADLVAAEPDYLVDHQADYRKTWHGMVGHFHRVPSEPVFGTEVPRALLEMDAQTLLRQAEAVEAQGYNILADTLRQLASLPGKRKTPARQKERLAEVGPLLPVSQMDLTRFPSDENAPEVMARLGEMALRYKPAAISVYGRHLKYLPVQALKEAGVHIGVVSAFPLGLGQADLAKELAELEAAVRAGADEVDVVMDFVAVKEGRTADAEASLARFALGVEELKNKYQAPLKIKTILETSALGDETAIRAATRIALKYSDTIKMVSGFPVVSDKGRKGRGSLLAARIMLEEILFYFQKTGILRGIKITGGIQDWDNPQSPDTSVSRYYDLVREILGQELGRYYLLGEDLFRIGGYDSIKNFLAAASRDGEQRSKETPVSGEVYEKYLAFSPEGLSFNPATYLASKLPAALIEEVAGGKATVEIHRGPASLSALYLGGLEAQGVKVEKLPQPQSAPPQHQFYRVEQGGKVRYVVTGVQGPSRELFLVQALVGFFHVPAGSVIIRDFGVEDLRPWLGNVLGAYAGRINRAVLMHEIDAYVAMLRKEGLGEGVERLRGDYADAFVVRAPSGELVLLLDMQAINGLQAGPVVDYLAAPVSEGGLGVQDITLHGASGGVGQDVRINDLVLYSDIYWDGNRQTNVAPNDINRERLNGLLPGEVQAHWLPVHDIATVLNGSQEMMRTVAQSGGGAVELELVHAAKEAALRPGVRFRAFYEVHDKPRLTQAAETESLRPAVPGHRDPLKRYQTWVALAKYLFAGKPELKAPEPVKIVPPQVTAANFSDGVARHANDVAKKVFANGNNNIVFLGTGEGLAYFAQLSSAWSDAKRKLVYWDARDYVVTAKRFTHFMDMMPFGEEGVPYHTVFIDHIEDILRDSALRKQLFESLRYESGIQVIGYMDSRTQADLERTLANEREGLAQLNFELTRESLRGVHDKKVVVLGATGLVGRTVVAELKRRGFTNVQGVSKSGSEKAGVKAVDLSNPQALQNEIARADVVVNAAVDLNFSGMEKEGEARDRARAVNVGIPQAALSAQYKGKFVQLSSFYVFGHRDGWVSPDDTKGPISEYGREKLEAEGIVSGLPNSLVVRLGPLIGIDDRGQQKKFYRQMVENFEAQRIGRPVQALKASTYPTSPVLSVQQTAESIVSLIEHDFRGTAQVSGKEPVNAVEQARRMAKVYNAMHGSHVKPMVEAERKTREGSLTPDVRMTTLTSPLLEDTFRDIIGQAGSIDYAMTFMNKGGIDFTADKMNLKLQRTGNGFKFNFDPVKIEQLQNASGLTPVIIDIRPLTTSVPMFLGLKEDAPPDQLSLRK